MSGIWTRNYSNCLCGLFAGRSAGSSHGAYYGNNNLSTYNRDGQLQQVLVSDSPLISFLNCSAAYGTSPGTDKL